MVVAKSACAYKYRSLYFQQAWLGEQLFPCHSAKLNKLFLSYFHSLDVGFDGVELNAMNYILDIDVN